MRYSIAALALAGAAAALPSHFARRDVVQDVVVVQDVQVVTDIVTVVAAPTPAPAAPVKAHVQAAAPQEPEVKVVTVVADAPAAPAPTPAPAPPAPAPAPQAPAPAPAPAPVQAAPSSAPAPSSSSSNSDPNSSDAILAVLNKWRGKYNLKPYTWSQQLANNAGRTGAQDQGVNQNHALFDKSYAQVITPGLDDLSGKDSAGLNSPFEAALLSGWLCEDPQIDELRRDCAKYAKTFGMDHSSGDKEHAQILGNPDYKTVGCGFAHSGQPQKAQWTGLWVCDFGF